jgi:thymidylate synthase (FAD)
VLPTDTKDGRDPWRARSRELWRGLETVAEQTTIIWTLNYRSLANVFNLRLAEGAQYETRKIAEAMFECFEGAYPLLAGMYKEG